MERWSIPNQHRLAYGRWRTRAFTDTTKKTETITGVCGETKTQKTKTRGGKTGKRKYEKTNAIKLLCRYVPSRRNDTQWSSSRIIARKIKKKKNIVVVIVVVVYGAAVQNIVMTITRGCLREFCCCCCCRVSGEEHVSRVLFIIFSKCKRARPQTTTLHDRGGNACDLLRVAVIAATALAVAAVAAVADGCVVILYICIILTDGRTAAACALAYHT